LSKNNIVDSILDHFYMVGKLQPNPIIVKMAERVNKAAILISRDVYFFAACNELNEHN
jgi:hypothetical protein